MSKPEKGSHHLRIGRVSLPWTTYLVTFCSHERKPGLAVAPIFDALCEELTRMERDAIWEPQALMLMPDHMHLIVRLGDGLGLPRAVARLKSKTRTSLSAAAIRWQPGYHDHRLRPDDARLPLFYYVFMNPVRAGLVADGAQWPFQWWRPEVWSWFEPYAQHAQDIPVWAKDLP